MAHPAPLALSGSDPHFDYTKTKAALFATGAAIRTAVRASGYIALGIFTGAAVGQIDTDTAMRLAEQAMPFAAALGMIKSVAGHTLDAVNARIHDSEEGQRLLKRIQSRAEGMFSIRRGALWLVSGPKFPRGPEVMSDLEYRDFRKSAEFEINEVTFGMDGDSALLRRFHKNRLDSGKTGEPAVVTYDLTFGRVHQVTWYDQGRKSTKEAIHERNAGRQEAFVQSARNAGVFEGLHAPTVEEFLGGPLFADDEPSAAPAL